MVEGIVGVVGKLEGVEDVRSICGDKRGGMDTEARQADKEARQADKEANLIRFELEKMRCYVGLTGPPHISIPIRTRFASFALVETVFQFWKYYQEIDHDQAPNQYYNMQEK
ncbi:hypothetical protein VNO80_19390 [Phaseolus coccineus]|uniref:Uncharacterized protein n=1 Tax=Phaseolus coccineus TaxID=3886 RepID=A0AAN9MJE9_PHACN